MANEIVDLPAHSGVVADTLLFPVYDSSAGSQKTRKISRGNLLSGVARDGDDVTFATLAGSTVVADEALRIYDEITAFIHGSGNVSIPTAAAGASQTATLAVVGASVGDSVLLTLPSTLPAGLICRAYVATADVVTVQAFNATASSISGATYAAKILVIAHRASTA